MKLSQIEVNKLSREQITRVLFGEEKDDGSKGDCIFTYGGRGIERVAKAVDLYQQKRANYILFTGGLKYGLFFFFWLIAAVNFSLIALALAQKTNDKGQRTKDKK